MVVESSKVMEEKIMFEHLDKEQSLYFSHEWPQILL